jgi:hypothetical protein
MNERVNGSEIETHYTPIKRPHKVLGLTVGVVAVEAASAHVYNLVKGPAPDGAEKGDLINEGAVARPIVEHHDQHGESEDRCDLGAD